MFFVFSTRYNYDEVLTVSTFTKGNANSPVPNTTKNHTADTMLVTFVFVLLWYVEVNITPLVPLVTGNLEHKGLMSGGGMSQKG